jgi:hypothetical protein
MPPWGRLDEALDLIGYDNQERFHLCLLAEDVTGRCRYEDGTVERLRPTRWRAAIDWTNSRLKIEGPQLFIFGPGARAPKPSRFDWRPVEVDFAELLKCFPSKAQTQKPSNSRRGAPEGLEEWYRNQHIPAGYSDRDEDLSAARERFGSWTKDRDTMRDLRRQHAPASWKDPGPKDPA